MYSVYSWLIPWLVRSELTGLAENKCKIFLYIYKTENIIHFKVLYVFQQ